jgi:hypothetical protein
MPHAATGGRTVCNALPTHRAAHCQPPRVRRARCTAGVTHLARGDDGGFPQRLADPRAPAGPGAGGGDRGDRVAVLAHGEAFRAGDHLGAGAGGARPSLSPWR